MYLFLSYSLLNCIISQHAQTFCLEKAAPRMEHKTLETTFKHSLREKQSELDPSWYKAQGQKKKKKVREMQYLHIRQMIDVFIHDSNL